MTSANPASATINLLNIVYVTTEAVPFAKTGGLADVCGTLPGKVAALGHRTAIIMPAFRGVRHGGVPVETTDISFAVPMSDGKLIGCRILKSCLPESEVPVWMIDQPQYFDREEIYGTAAGDYPDNAERFAFFCRAAIQAMQRMNWSIDIVHCNDWQSGLIPLLLKTTSESALSIRDAATVMAVHNLAYQGRFEREAFSWTGLDPQHSAASDRELDGQLNYLKIGIVAADSVATVSPQYADEIRTPRYGCGLDPVLIDASERMVGIINGIDPAQWDPSNDPVLYMNYSVANWRDGKLGNKRGLQQEFGLEPSDEVPLIGLIGRLASQKGWDLILPVLHAHLREDRPVQWMILGSGDPQYEQELRRLADQHPGRCAVHIGFSDALAHQIEAASDVLVMPSHYEPCGLNQLYSLRYGTVPVVSPTGGLLDTVIDCTESSLKDRTATGFHLREMNEQSLDEAIGRALHLRYHAPDQWAGLIETGMNQDWSWTRSAKQYVSLYKKARIHRAAVRKPPLKKPSSGGPG